MLDMSYVTDRFDEKVVGLLKSGAVGFMPSDTIYGLSCLALDQGAVERLHKIKDRQAHKPFVILISDAKMLDKLSINLQHSKLVDRYWPGPLTIVFDAPAAPAWLQLGSQTLAVRLPADKKLQDLINKTGPLVSTSANLQGESPALNVKEAQKVFGNKLDFYVDVGKLDNKPSTLVVNKDGKLVVIRQGAAKLEI